VGWRVVVFAASLMLAGTMAAAQQTVAAAVPREAMDNIAALLEGRWQGSFRLDPGKPPLYDVASTFVVERKAGGTLVLMDVTYTLSVVGQPPDPTPYSEVALLFFDPVDKGYRFELHFADGKHESGRASLDGSVLRIINIVPDGGFRRLTINRVSANVWHETGERSADGKIWRTYLDARFTRVNE
jgi:hypothetical protein